MFTVEARDLMLDRLLRAADGDPAVGGAALTGSLAADGGDRAR